MKYVRREPYHKLHCLRLFRSFEKNSHVLFFISVLRSLGSIVTAAKLVDLFPNTAAK